MNPAMSLEILNRILFGGKHVLLSIRAEIVPPENPFITENFLILFHKVFETGITVVLKISLMIHYPLEGTQKNMYF